MKNILSEITITIEGVKIKRDCTLVLDGDDKVDRILVHPASKKSEQAYEDITEVMLDTWTGDEYRHVNNSVSRLLAREPDIEDNDDPRVAKAIAKAGAE